MIISTLFFTFSHNLVLNFSQHQILTEFLLSDHIFYTKRRLRWQEGMKVIRRAQSTQPEIRDLQDM